MGSPRSKVEVKGLEAKLYDQLLDIVTLGQYPRLLKRVFSLMDIKPGDSIIDFGSGTGRNACYMLKKAGKDARFVGLDINEDMIKKARKKCKDYPNAEFINMRIEKTIPFENEFDIAFISFVLHGFEDYDKEKILENVRRALKPGGKFYVFDYAEFDVDKAPFYVKFFIRKLECPLAEEFINLDLKEFLRKFGFSECREWTFAGNVIRLLEAK